MGSTGFDAYRRILSPTDQQAPSVLELGGVIQPTAEIAWGSEFSTPPLVDRPYAMGSGDSAFVGNPTPLGTVGAQALGSVVGVPFGFEPGPGCWYWVQLVAGWANPDRFYRLVHLTAPAAAALISGASPIVTSSIQMSDRAAQRIVTTFRLLGTFLLQTNSMMFRGLADATPGPASPATTQDKQPPWVGPLFAPRGIIPVMAGTTDQTTCVTNWRWIEIPDHSRRLA